MRGRWGNTRNRDHLTDILEHLAGWTRDGWEIQRTLCLDDAQHAALTERIKVVADAMQLRPQISRRDGNTLIRLVGADADALDGELALAARIEHAYRTVCAPAPALGPTLESEQAPGRATTLPGTQIPTQFPGPDLRPGHAA